MTVTDAFEHRSASPPLWRKGELDARRQPLSPRLATLAFAEPEGMASPTKRDVSPTLQRLQQSSSVSQMRAVRTKISTKSQAEVSRIQLAGQDEVARVKTVVNSKSKGS